MISRDRTLRRIPRDKANVIRDLISARQPPRSIVHRRSEERRGTTSTSLRRIDAEVTPVSLPRNEVSADDPRRREADNASIRARVFARVNGLALAGPAADRSARLIDTPISGVAAGGCESRIRTPRSIASLSSARDH